jgi:hypothetical protein
MEETLTGTVSKFNRLANGWARVLVNFNIDDDPAFVEYYEPYGFTSSVAEGSKVAEAVVHTPLGNYDNAFCSLINFRGSSKPATGNGESAIYWTTNPAHFIRIGENGDYVASKHSFVAENGYEFKKGESELVSVLIEIINAIATASNDSNKKPVTNELLPALIEKLKAFVPA